MNVLTVCGLGIGSSVILRVTVGKILDELGIKDYTINVADIGTAKSTPFDMVVTSTELADVLKKALPADKQFKVIPVSNFVDKNEIKSKIVTCLKQMGKL